MFTTFKAQDVPLFVEGSAFHDPWHYGKIMGYDKYALQAHCIYNSIDGVKLTLKIACFFARIVDSTVQAPERDVGQ